MGSKVLDNGFQGTDQWIPMYWTVGSKVLGSGFQGKLNSGFQGTGKWVPR